MQAIHAKKLEQALRSHERFPINLEWMVDVFKYKHISSLTTHLKRHFKMNVHYKRFAQEQNKRVWTYFISVECFIGICEYVRHAARKKIANVWLRKVGIKGSSRRVVRDYEEEFPDVSEEEEEEEMEDEEEDDDEEEEEEDPEFEYYEEDVPAKRRRIDDDDEYQCEEEDDESEERSYFQEMEDEETYADSETDSSALDYDSSSSSSRADSPPMRHRTASLTVASTPSQQSFQGRQLVSFSMGNPPHYRALLTRSSSSSSSSLNSSTCSKNSSSSSPSSSAPSSPTNSPRAARAHLTSSGSTSQNKLVPTPVCAASSSGLGGSSGSLQSGNTTSNSRSQQNNSPHPTNCNTTATKQPTVVPESSAPPNEADESSKEQVDWSYLHLRPNPLPLGGGGGVYDMPSKYLASLMFGPQYCAYPQQSPYNYVLSANAFFSNYHPPLYQSALDSHSSSNFNARCAGRHEDAAYAHHGDMDERQFDTNMFLSFPEEHHYQQYQSPSSHNP